MNNFRKPALPFFNTVSGRRIFSLLHSSLSDVVEKKALLVCPPFADEMNKSRHILTQLSSQLNQKHCDVLLVDLYGTGDSEGELIDATWEKWCEDIINGMHWLKAEGYQSISLLGVRLGALLVADVLSREGDLIDNVILWQPVSNGELAMKQFLRLRTASQMMEEGSANKSAKELLEALNRDGSIEVAGYDLSFVLFDRVRSLKLKSFVDALKKKKCWWLDVVAERGGEPTPASKRVCKELQEGGVSIKLFTAEGEPFWSTIELGYADELVSKTVDAMSS